MNDITALALRMKAKAIEAKSTEDWGCDSDNFHDVATPDNVLALVGALEKAQHDAAVNWEAATSMNVENQELKQRIASLESRSVTVKLPQRLQPGADGYDDWYVHSAEDGEYLKVDDVIAMLAAAGINVEAE